MNEQSDQDHEIDINKEPMLDNLDEGDNQIRHRKTTKEEKKLKKNKERINFFIRTWTPQPTINSTALCFFVFGVVFLALGYVIYSVNSKIIEEIFQYDDFCQGVAQNEPCTMNINIKQNMTSPIFVYYQMSNFYQNHRRYYQSRNTEQLAGKYITKPKLKRDCYPVIWLEDVREVLNVNQTKRMNTYNASQNLTWGEIPAYPCGLMAKSFFNDTYTLMDPKLADAVIFINETDIAWSTDIDTKFKEQTTEPLRQWLNVTNEHFIVWARNSGLSNFRKLWGRINIPSSDKQLYAQNYTIQIMNNYNVSKFGGSKSIIFSTVAIFGGKNNFVWSAYLFCGAMCIVIAFIFKCKQKWDPQNFKEYEKVDED